MQGRYYSQLSFNNLVRWKRLKTNSWLWKEYCYRQSNSTSILNMLINLLSRYISSAMPYLYSLSAMCAYLPMVDFDLTWILVLWRFTWWAIEIAWRRKNKRNGSTKLEFCKWFVLYKPLPPMGTSNYCNLYDLFSWKNTKGKSKILFHPINES